MYRIPIAPAVLIVITNASCHSCRPGPVLDILHGPVAVAGVHDTGGAHRLHCTKHTYQWLLYYHRLHYLVQEQADDGQCCQ